MIRIIHNLQRGFTLHGPREVILDSIPERPPAHLQVLKRGAAEVQERHGQFLGDPFQRLSQCLVDTGKRIGTGELEDLGYEAQQVVVLEEVGEVEDAAC